MRRDLAVLQSMELFELFESEGKNVVIERLGRASEKPFERRFVAGSISGINGHCAPRMAPGFALNPKLRAAAHQIHPASVGSTVHRFVTFGASTLLESEQHRTNERHESALACFIWAEKNI